MKYYNINNKSERVDFKDAIVLGQARDGGLFFPEQIPIWNKAFIESIQKKSKVEIGFEIMKPYVGDALPDDVLMDILQEVLSFEFPLKKINDQIYSLELFHGPTLAFKDVGARFLSRCLHFHISKKREKKILVLVATSGDTGGAVADAFHGIDGTEVVILYPSGKVSPVQEKQLTTYGDNIHALEVMGDFDDCQRMVKQAFLDQDLHKQFVLTSSNSINIARWLSQQIYYAVAFAQWPHKDLPTVAVPSGNFGNLCAGLVAQASGLPIAHFIAACNKNAVFSNYLDTGNYMPQSAIPTLSNAMDVGNPSNVIRIQELFNYDYEKIKNNISGSIISDKQTKETIALVYKNHNYLLDPHGAVAYTALNQWLNEKPKQKGIVLATAHPVKFLETVESATNTIIPIPPEVKKIMKKEKRAKTILIDYECFKREISLFFVHSIILLNNFLKFINQ